MEAIVDYPEDLTARWLTEALRASGYDLTIADVGFERVGTGQMATTYRLNLSHQEGSQGPTTLIAKMAGDDEKSRALVAPGYAAEVGFYTELASSLDVRTPRCWYGAIASDHTRTLLLDDVSPALSGVQSEGCTVEQASASLRNLIGLHLPRWNDPKLRDLEFLPRPDKETASMMAHVMSLATSEFIERYGRELSDQDQQTHPMTVIIGPCSWPSR